MRSLIRALPEKVVYGLYEEWDNEDFLRQSLKAFRLPIRTHRSANAFRFGPCGGSCRHRMPSDSKTWSKAANRTSRRDHAAGSELTEAHRPHRPQRSGISA